MKINNNIRMKLVSRNPIPFGRDYIHQRRIKEIDNEIGIDMLDLYIYPFSLTKELINIDEVLKKGHKLFDLILMSDLSNMGKENYYPLISILNDSLKFFFNTDMVTFNQGYQIIQDNDKYEINNLQFIINGGTIVNKDNFDDLADLILLSTNHKRLKVEKKEEIPVEVGTSPEAIQRYRDYLRLSQEAEEKEKIKKIEENSIPYIVNLLANKNEKTPNYEEIINLSVWQLYNSYSSAFSIEEYENTMAQKNSGQFDMSKVKFKHWTESLNNLFRNTCN